MKPVLGVVGGIGSGKSAVAEALAAHGGWRIDADALASSGRGLARSEDAMV